ncbi:MAG: type IV secretory system conjugative DNA transfer family protein [Chloroflexi bacterium]|nr:type IV secretory system conjugative DNA transfer family protein [Chloroflexota bacterium]
MAIRRQDDPTTQGLIPFTADELGQIKVALATPRHRNIIETNQERLIVSPYPLRQTFKAVSMAMRARFYHGNAATAPLIEDLLSGTIKGRRAILEGTPSAVRLLKALPFVGAALDSWIVDAEVRTFEHNKKVFVGFRLRTTLPQRIGVGLTAREFAGLVEDFQRLLPTARLDPQPVHDPVVGPGQQAPESYTGTLRDYSRCAALAEVARLREGDFPLGRYLWPSDAARGTVPLALGSPMDDAGRPSEHLIFRNVCVTAPVGTGKTYSIFQPWAVAAARAGFSTLVFDAKGDLAAALTKPVFDAGSRVVIFSTSPEQPSVPWNFLDEIEVEPDGRLKSRRAVDAIVEALLGDDVVGKGRDRDEFASRLFRGWLGGFIQIAKYALGDEADASVLHQMAREETKLHELLNRVRERWPEHVYARLYYEVNDLFDKFEWGYSAQLRGVASALSPFTHEPLASRTRARPGARRFRIRDLDRRPTMFLLNCPLRDLQAARRVGSVASSLLMSYVYERQAPEPGQHDARIPLVLLLDETRLLSTNLAEFLAVGRGFKAGVVTCYQELDQIRDEAMRREILTNSNTLVALRGVGPGSRRAIAERLARTTVQSATVGGSTGEDAREQVIRNRTPLEVAVLGEYEMRTLPGPKYVALVHIQDDTVRGSKPFLVDLSNNGGSLVSEVD